MQETSINYDGLYEAAYFKAVEALQQRGLSEEQAEIDASVAFCLPEDQSNLFINAAIAEATVMCCDDCYGKVVPSHCNHIDRTVVAVDMIVGSLIGVPQDEKSMERGILKERELREQSMLKHYNT